MADDDAARPAGGDEMRHERGPEPADRGLVEREAAGDPADSIRAEQPFRHRALPPGGRAQRPVPASQLTRTLAGDVTRKLRASSRAARGSVRRISIAEES